MVERQLDRPGHRDGALDYEGRYRVGSRSFFQVNRFLIDRLVERAIEGSTGTSAVDLYAGVGLFSLPLAARFGQVTAVESGAAAVRDLEFNAERAGLTNVAARHSSAEQYLESLESAPGLMLLDPPRAGLGKRVAASVAALRPPRLTIVACDPSTLARDLAGLVAAGYHVEQMLLVDLFPQTYHFETIVKLRC